MNNTEKISISSLDLYYTDFKALKNINLKIPENKITAFIGPSGCGKSTLLKSLNRMNDLVEGCRIEGSILLDGEDIYGRMDVNLLRKRVGMVFQKPNPFPMSIYDNIAFGPRTHGIHSKAKLDDIVERSLRDAAIWECPVASSRGSASQERWLSSRKSSLWMNPHPPLTLYPHPRLKTWQWN